MKAALVLLACVAVLGCAGKAPPAPPPRAVPPELAGCPGRVHGPPALPRLKDFPAIEAYVNRLDAALVRSEAARAECARRLAALNQWIEGTP